MLFRDYVLTFNASAVRTGSKANSFLKEAILLSEFIIVCYLTRTRASMLSLFLGSQAIDTFRCDPNKIIVLSC